MTYVRVWLWCDLCESVAVLHKGGVCVRCVAALDAAHPELHDLDDVARELGIDPASLIDQPRRSPLAWLRARLAGKGARHGARMD